VPTVFQPHAWSWHAAGSRLRRATWWWERSAMTWTDLLIAVSDGELAEGLRQGVQARRTAVIPNGVDVRRFAPGDREAARQRLRLGPQPLAVCIGRLAHQKGQDLAIAAWEHVRPAVPTARLAIVGDGPKRPDLAQALTPGVGLYGAVGDPRDWFAAADVVVLPSRWEGMALVPLEAMASSRPVVGFDVAGVAESIGDAGCVVPPGDVESLAEELVRRLGDPDSAEKEGLLGRERAVTLFDRAQTVARTTEATRALSVAYGRGGRVPGPRAVDPAPSTVILPGAERPRPTRPEYPCPVVMQPHLHDDHGGS
jgi:glycosyltransferase involved in cell wall biosynthesis